MTQGMNRYRWSLIVALAVLLVGCNDHESGESSVPQTNQPPMDTPSIRVVHPSAAVQGRVRTESVTARTVPEIVTAPGEVSLDLKQVAKVTSKIEGQVVRVYAQLGDRVRAGQPLVAIGSLQLDQLVEEYLVAKSQADVAESSFRRSEQLRADLAGLQTAQRIFTGEGADRRRLGEDERQAKMKDIEAKLAKDCS